jgi:hypothetical protein
MLTAAQQAAVSQAIKESFVSGYRWTMVAAGLLAFLSALIAAVSLRKRTNEAKAPLPPGGADIG